MAENEQISDYMTTAEAAAFLGVNASRVRQMITDKILVARQWDGRTWMVRRDSVEAERRIMEGRRKPGPPPGTPRKKKEEPSP